MRRSNQLQKIIFMLCFLLMVSYLMPVWSQEVKWIKIGSLHNWFREDGCEPEVGRTGLQADQQDGLRWPAQYRKQDNIAAKALWIGTTNFTDAEQYGGNTYPIKVVHVGPRGWDVEREFIPVTFKMIGRHDHPLVYVDGVSGSELMWDDLVDETDPELPCDRLIYNVVNTSLGITETRKVMAFAQQHHENYYIYEYVFKNTGNVDKDAEIEKPNQTLENVYFSFQYRYAVSREGADATDLNSPRWGINTMLDTRGEAKPSDGPQYKGDYDAWLKGNTQADSLRCQFAWMGPHSNAAYDLVGGPDVKYKTGRLMSPQFIGVVTLYADKSATDKSDDPLQPKTTTYQQSDDPPTRPNDQFDVARMAEEWKWMTRGHRLPRHAEAVGTGFPDKFEGTPGGFSNLNSYGPYTLGPGDSIRIVLAEGVNGLNRQLCEELGKKWYEAYSNPNNTYTFELPNKTTTTNKDEFKNAWVMTGKDSLFKTFGRARRNFNLNYNIELPPPPPDFFEISSGGDRIRLKWSTNAESDPTFAGYRIFRAVAKYDTTYQEIFACGKGTANSGIVNTYDDMTAVRGFSYYYYIASFSKAENGSLQSSMFWTRTIEPAYLRRAPGEALSEIRVVPNPYNIRLRELQYPGERDKIMFLNIPGECTIRIYTERGDLIYKIDHNDGSGDEDWNCVTEYGQVIVSGVYIAVFETPAGEREIRKFAVIR